MSKEDTSSGLLSKMVKFVRNPATSWSDLDNKDTDRDEALSKQLLKEMIERKRQNDFVRKREFDLLRKMRKRESMVGQDAAARPSFFQSSLPSKPDDRARTIKKIDEIEAQMSMQWWKTKNGDATTGAADSSVLPQNADAASTQQPPQKLVLPPAYAATEPAPLQSAQAAQAEQIQALAQAPKMANPAQIPVLRSIVPAVAAPPRVPAKAPSIGGLAWVGSDANGPSGFTNTNLMAVDVGEIAHDAELEEAAILFANGDDEGAEAGLLEMLTPGGSRALQPEVWLALFDLYRATDQQEKFEAKAIPFVQLFDRSGPQWFSLPQMVQQMAKQMAKSDRKGQSSGPAADWVCSSVLGVQTVAALKAAVAKAPMPWRIDWTNLKSIDAAAVDPLYKVFASWSSQPVQLRFTGDTQLQKVLLAGTPSRDRETIQDRWYLRMESLRVTHRPDEFEFAALDYCITYEVSPPAWESARCEYKPLDPEGLAMSGHTIIGDVYRDSTHSGLSLLDGDSQLDALSSQVASFFSVELSGQIEGDAVAVLDRLEAKLVGADIMMISCAKLIRVDFSAAGTLLNWVSARQAEHRAVQFTDVNRLVAAFFNVIGITEYARVVTRVD